MAEVDSKLDELDEMVHQAYSKLAIEKAKKELASLREKSQATDFWADNLGAQEIMKHIARLETKIKPWEELSSAITEAKQLSELNDSSLEHELHEQANKLDQQYNDLKSELRFNQPYDDHSAIVTISAGAGGTDAQDWTQMLFRMYIRWCEKNSYPVSVIEESAGEEAGLKRVIFSVEGSNVYGKLRAEHGVHRLVRLSPFNSDNLRQTSFAKVDVVPKIDEPSELELDEKEVKVDVYRAGGHGGQSVNTTDSAVRLTHLPTGISVAIQNERSQLQNKETAFTILRSRLAGLQMEQHQEHLDKLKGPNQSAEWGNQIRSYVLHPYKQVKDLRSGFESSEPMAILDGQLNELINAYLDSRES